MCGIVGYFGSFEPAFLAKANELQSHRGPDADGTWFDVDAGIVLAHRRLSGRCPNGRNGSRADADDKAR